MNKLLVTIKAPNVTLSVASGEFASNVFYSTNDKFVVDAEGGIPASLKKLQELGQLSFRKAFSKETAKLPLVKLSQEES